jgi:hypothetical protein
LIARAIAFLRGTRLTTPVLLRIGMVVACLPIALFAVSVHLSVTRNDSTVRTVGRDATQGITAAQQIKLKLAELDELVSEDLLNTVTPGPSGFPDDYNAKRSELESTLVLAASKAPSGAAYQQPLANIHYALGHYHALLKESFAIGRGDTKRAAALYGRAHDVMDGTLLPQADSFDKANTYVLNNTYDRHKSDSSSSVRLIVVSWLSVLALLVAAQFALARKFRRVINVGLAAATVVAAASGAFALTKLDSSSSNLSVARERAFDAVHQLARARATLVAARQAEGLLLLDPSAAAAAQADFSAQAAKLFRVQGSPQVASIARAGRVPPDAGGYLAAVINADVSKDGNAAAKEALVAAGGFLMADGAMRTLVAGGDAGSARAMFQGAQAFGQLTSAITKTQAIDQDTFNTHAASAASATRPVDLVNLIAAGSMLTLIVLGLYARLREYGD